jgi:DNA-directed RNA polymerase subunit M
MMEFCPKCENLMIVKKKRSRSFLVCTKCGHERPLKKEKLVIKETLQNGKREVLVMGKGTEAMDLPKTKIICPKCENPEAYWWMQQTRSADEPPTLFYRCTKCSYSWRSYG